MIIYEYRALNYPPFVSRVLEDTSVGVGSGAARVLQVQAGRLCSSAGRLCSSSYA